LSGCVISFERIESIGLSTNRTGHANQKSDSIRFNLRFIQFATAYRSILLSLPRGEKVSAQGMRERLEGSTDPGKLHLTKTRGHQQCQNRKQAATLKTYIRLAIG
jgi:hypothetical protein